MDDKAIATGTSRTHSHGIGFAEAFWVWLKIGLLSFGGPAGQIALMHRLLVEEKRWISESRFLHALNYCMLLPGPEAQQLATYVGWLLHRTLGGLVAGVLFILPGFFVMLLLSIAYALYQELPLMAGIFYGVKAAVLAVVVEAVLRIGKRALKNGAMVAIAAAAFVGIFFLNLPFPLIVIGAGVLGYLGGRWRPDTFVVIKGHAAKAGAPAVDALLDEGQLAHAQPSLKRALKVLALCLTLWFAPILLALALLGPEHVFVQESVFFSKMAVVTFGGAYAVLAYVAQAAVEVFGWLRPGEMLDGLGLAETTPGPLILVVEYVGFLAAYREAGVLSPLWAGTLGAVLVTWVTFVPCFLWIFLGAPYVERLRGNQRLSAALSAITAAVVGVVLNLALWFGLHVVFGQVDEIQAGVLRLHAPVLTSLDPLALALAAAAMLAMLRFKLGMLWVLGVSAALGAGLKLVV